MGGGCAVKMCITGDKVVKEESKALVCYTWKADGGRKLTEAEYGKPDAQLLRT